MPAPRRLLYLSPIPDPLPNPHTRASQPTPAAGCVARILGWWTHTPSVPTPDPPRSRRQRHPDIAASSRQRPAFCAAAPRRALAAPRDGHALRVGALTGPRPRSPSLRLSQSAPSLVMSVRTPPRGDCSSSDPSGTCSTSSHRPPACLALQRARPWLVDGVPTLASMLHPGVALRLRMRRRAAIRDSSIVCCTSYLPTASTLLLFFPTRVG
jgi:hypothetical protein